MWFAYKLERPYATTTSYFIVLDGGLSFLENGKKSLVLSLNFIKISGLFLPAVVRPILDSLEGSKHVPEKQPSISDVSI